MREMQQMIGVASGGRVFGPTGAAHWVTERYGREASADALRRWIRTGLQTPDGRTVKLAASRVGGRLVVREADLCEFLAALQPAGVAGA